MASTSLELSALGNDAQFRARVQSLLVQQAATVYAEAPAVPDTRRAFAKQVLNNPSAFAVTIATVIANRPNLIAQTVTYDWNNGRPVTDATDAQIASQIATDWSMLAGV
jgi:hypothetical protein